MNKKYSLFVLLIISLSTFFIFNNNNKNLPPKPMQGDRDNPYGAEQFRHDMIAGNSGYIDPQSRMQAIDYTAKKLLREDKLMKTTGIPGWTPLGPGNIGGRIRSIVIKTSNTANILIGSVSGGIWKTTNGGSSWTPKLDNGSQLAIGSMIKDPSNENIVYAGTGEGWNNSDNVYGGGIYKSIDFGETWNLLSSTIGTNIWSFSNVRSMAFDPSGNLYAVTYASKRKDGVGSYYTNGGLFKSTDGGNSWSLISPSTMATNYFNGDDVIPFSSTTIIFATGPNGSTLGGIYRTTDGGSTWDKMTTNLPSTNYRRIAFAKDPKSSSIGYAQIESSNYSSPDYGLAGIYKTTDAGATWAALPRPGTLPSTSSTSFLSNQGWYDNVIAVDPFNSKNIYVGGVDMMKSTDGGSTWAQLTYWHSYYGTPEVHADHHAIAFDPVTANVVYTGNDGGIYKTSNGGSTWTNLNNNLAITQFYSGAVYPTGSTYSGGTQDNGHLMFSSGTNWDEVYGGDGGYSAQDQTNSLVSFEEYVYLDISKSTDGGQNWTESISGLTDANNSTNSLFISPFVMNPLNSSVLLAGSNKVWATINSAGSWTQVSSALTSGKVSALTITNSASPYLGFAGTTDGHVFKCTSLNPANGINTWTDISPSGNNASYVRRITVDPSNQQNIYVCYSGYNNNGLFPTKHIWYSGNQGSTWADISGDLPDVPVHSLLVDNNVSTTLYIGTEIGVYQSTNRGTNWVSASSGMPPYVPVDELVYQKGTSYLFAFTHGRGVFVTSSATAVRSDEVSNIPSNFELSQNYPNPFNPSTSIKYSIPVDANVKVSIYNIKGELVTTLVNQFQKAGYYTATFNGTDLSSGVYLYKVEAGNFNQVKKMVLLK